MGVISPSGNEIGPFKAIEESTISHLVSTANRSSVFAWYILLGEVGTATGTFLGGWVIEALQVHGWGAQDAYRVVFWAYSALRLMKFGITMMLGSDCEQDKTNPPTSIANTEYQPLLAEQHKNGMRESKPLLADQHEQDSEGPTNPTPTTSRSLLPTLSAQSTTVVLKMCLLFAIESAAYGLIPSSWISYFYSRQFQLTEGTIGTLFSSGMIVASASNLAAPALTKRLGLVKAMVYTHVPASLGLALIPLPTNAGLSMALFMLRSCTSSMDQPPRQAFIAGAVLAEERTAVMGLINVVKTLAQSVGPTFTGVLASQSKLWMAFIIAGCLRLVYDVLMLAMFLGYRPREDQAKEVGDAQDRADEP